MMLLKGQKHSRGTESKFNKNLRMPAADIFMCSLLRTVVSFLEQRFVRVDWLGVIGVFVSLSGCCRSPCGIS